MRLHYLVLACPFFAVKAWVLQDDINVDTWQDLMRLETRVTNKEFVKYLRVDEARSRGFIKSHGDALYLGVDSTTVLNPSSGEGRASVRIRTKKVYNAGTLVIGDFDHMPANVCGIWPSFWLVGPAWPQDGEIDILEGVNQMTQNQVTIHTLPGCVPRNGTGGASGQGVGFADCGDNGGDIGCGMFTTGKSAWGSAFNEANGGVYAMMWTNTSIKVWHWEREAIPRDVSAHDPDPSAWGKPVANWTGCRFGELMNNMSIIVNTSFCGSWAGAVWKTGSCAALADQCDQYVAANPQIYVDAYWLIRSIRVYR